MFKISIIIYNKNMKKSIILVIASRNLPIYDEFVKNYWIPFIKCNNKNKESNTKIFLIYGTGVDMDYVKEISDNVIIAPCEERFDNLITKTIYSIHYCYIKYNCDYIFRTNLSSFIIYKNYINVLESLPENNTYAGVIGTYNYNDLGIPKSLRYISGAGFFLSKDLFHMLLSNITNSFKFDDVIIGNCLKNIELTNINNLYITDKTSCSEEELETYYQECENNKYYHIRINNYKREVDVQIMKYLVEKYYV